MSALRAGEFGRVEFSTPMFDVDYHLWVRTPCLRRRNFWRFLLGWPAVPDRQLQRFRMPMAELRAPRFTRVGGDRMTITQTVTV